MNGVGMIFGVIFWFAFWPGLIVGLVLQILLAKTEGKYNGLYVPILMYLIPVFMVVFSALGFLVDGGENFLVWILTIFVTLLGSAIIPALLYLLYRVLHKQYLRDKRPIKKTDDIDKMKIHDL